MEWRELGGGGVVAEAWGGRGRDGGSLGGVFQDRAIIVCLLIVAFVCQFVLVCCVYL